MTETHAEILIRRVEALHKLERLVGKRRLRLVWDFQNRMLSSFVTMAHEDLASLDSPEKAHCLFAKAAKLLRKELRMQNSIDRAFRDHQAALELVIEWFVEQIPEFFYCHVGHSLRTVRG